eukprot:9936276-Alexandrium_andersonii.AAC.1
MSCSTGATLPEPTSAVSQAPGKQKAPLAGWLVCAQPVIHWPVWWRELVGGRAGRPLTIPSA